MTFVEYFNGWQRSHLPGDVLTVEVIFKHGFSNTTQIPHDALRSAKWVEIISNLSGVYRVTIKSNDPKVMNACVFLDAQD